MKKRALLIGGTGFVGPYLQQHLQNDYDVVAVGRNIDVRIKEQLRQLIATTMPDVVIHLAGQSFVPESFKNPRETFDINFIGTFNLLSALKYAGFPGRFLFIGSGDVYGLVPPDLLPLLENYPLRPRNPYAVSKVAAEALCYQWSQTEGFDIVMARPFSHIGPGQSDRFVISDFARQIIEIKLRRREPVLRVGDIDVTRDFTDVRDVVRAYQLLLENGKNGEVYNVCSGNEYSIRALLQQMMEIAGVDAKLEQDNERLRPSEQRRLCGSFDKLQKKTGWQPKLAIERTLQDILNYWKEKVNG